MTLQTIAQINRVLYPKVWSIINCRLGTDGTAYQVRSGCDWLEHEPPPVDRVIGLLPSNEYDWSVQRLERNPPQEPLYLDVRYIEGTQALPSPLSPRLRAKHRDEWLNITYGLVAEHQPLCLAVFGPSRFNSTDRVCSFYCPEAMISEWVWRELQEAVGRAELEEPEPYRPFQQHP